MGTPDGWKKYEAERKGKAQEAELGQKETRPAEEKEMDGTTGRAPEIR